MKKRNPIAVVLLPLITLGIYWIYWLVKTKGEMKELGANIPTSWLMIVPIVNIWWFWKYSEGVEHVTGGKLNGLLVFVLLWLLGFIGSAIVQDSFNNNLATANNVAPVENVAAPVEAVSAIQEAVPTPVEVTAPEEAPAVPTTPVEVATTPATPTETTDGITPPTTPTV